MLHVPASNLIVSGTKTAVTLFLSSPDKRDALLGHRVLIHVCAYEAKSRRRMFARSSVCLSAPSPRTFHPPPPHPHLPGQAVGLGSEVPEVGDLAPDDVHAAGSAGVLGVPQARLGRIVDELADATVATEAQG